MTLSASVSALWPKLKQLAYFAIALSLCFSVALWSLLKFCLKSDLFSYIPLIPVITAYLIWLKKDIFAQSGPAPRLWAALPALAAAGVLGCYWMSSPSEGKQAAADGLTLLMLAYVLFFWAGCMIFLPGRALRQIIFPLAFLLFFVPLPSPVVGRIDVFFQHASAATAEGMISLVGTPIIRDHLNLQLPDITLTVAPECSGIHSTLVLVMTAFLAGYLFLQKFWKQALLVLIVIPLAVLRNGFRIFVIGELCVHVGPQMIDSPIHRNGGPIFFALSLIPFFLILFYLRRIGEKKAPAIVPA